MPHGAATVSLLSADIGKPKVKHVAVANKALRFFKETSDIPLRFTRFVKCLADVRVGGYTDAAWANRADSSSQGGFLICIDDDGVQNGTMKALIVADWASRKLRRICRSSLSAEAQAACITVDALEWTKIFISLLLRPDVPADDESHCRALGISPLVTDAKALYDASRSESAGLGLTEKRTAIEVMILNERLKALLGVWKWTNTFQQLADGLTKIDGRQGLAESLRRGCHSLKYDPSYTAGKKLTKQAKDERQQEYEDFAKAKSRRSYKRSAEKILMATMIANELIVSEGSLYGALEGTVSGIALLLQILSGIALLVLAGVFAWGFAAMLQLVRNPLVAERPRTREEATQTDELPRPLPAPPVPPPGPRVLRGLPERVYVARRAVMEGREPRYHTMQYCGGLSRAQHTVELGLCLTCLQRQEAD
jgi:hypothetical protein